MEQIFAARARHAETRAEKAGTQQRVSTAPISTTGQPLLSAVDQVYSLLSYHQSLVGDAALPICRGPALNGTVRVDETRFGGY